jgi:hypothetical protein
MKKKIVIIFLVFSYALVLGQQPPQVSETSPLKISLQLKKNQYFPCEEIQFNVQIQNISDRALTLPPLNGRPHVWISVDQLSPSGRVLSYAIEPSMLKAADLSRPAIDWVRLEPKQLISMTYDLGSSSEMPSAPCHEGEFVLSFRYLDRVSTANLNVVTPSEIQAVSLSDFPQDLFIQKVSRKEPVRISDGSLKQVVFAYGYRDHAFICSMLSPLTAGLNNNLQVKVKVGSIGAEVPYVLATFRCFDTNAKRLQKLSSRWNAAGQLMVSFEDDQQSFTRMLLDQKMTRIW